ncbi:MAG: hypothetical protein U1F53_13280 [Burkholderiaceae bacterium]
MLKALDRFGFGSLGIVRRVRFDACYPQRVTVDLAGLPLPVIDLASFKANKRASGRLKDLADLESLGDDPPE